MNEVIKTAYMIRRNSDGLFSTGGMSPKFAKNGKAWTGLGPLKNHLHQFHNWYGDINAFGFPYKDCSIVVLKSVVTMSPPEIQSNVQSLFDELRETTRKEYEERRKRWGD